MEASTEVVVPNGTPVLVAAGDASREAVERRPLGRRGERAATRSWIVVSARVVEDPAEAFPIPAELRPRGPR